MARKRSNLIKDLGELTREESLNQSTDELLNDQIDNSVNKSPDWKRFEELAKQYASNKKADCPMFVDAELKALFDMLKASGLNIPVKHMINAVIKIFVEKNKDEIQKILASSLPEL